MPVARTYNEPYTAQPNGSASAASYSGVGIVIFPPFTAIPGVESSCLTDGVLAEWETNADGVVIRSRELDEEAFGVDLVEAKADFLTSLYDRHISLRERENLLSDRDRTVLQKLDSILRR